MEIKQPTIKQATKLAYEKMQDEFMFYTLVNIVRIKLSPWNKRPLDGTIQRRLRELREDGVLSYDYNSKNGEYVKKKTWTMICNKCGTFFKVTSQTIVYCPVCIIHILHNS